MPWTVSWRVLINGRDLTGAWRPVLIDIEVEDRDGTSSDSCSLTIDDTDGQVRLPQKGDRLVVYLEGGKVFEGFIEQPQSTSSRSEGRRLKIRAKGFDSTGKVKEPQGFHMDDASLEAFLGRAAEYAGVSIAIDPDFADITRDYWSAEGESFLALGNRMAKKLGGTFKIRGDQAVLAKRGAEPVGTVAGVVGQNIVGWDITPRAPRHSFKSGSAKWFDRKAAQFVTERLDFGAEGAEADNLSRDVMADADEAKEANDAHKREGEREDGGGTVDLDLTVEAAAEALFTLSGARPGVDGNYRIASVRHRADRSGGSRTSLELKHPSDGAGKDERKATTGGGSSAGGSSSDGDFALPRHEILG